MASKSIEVLDRKFDISYEIVNPNQKKDIVILHGWGSNKEIMKQAFGRYLSEFRHIYIDMPGFGKSSNNYVLTTKDYSLIIKKFIETLNTNVVAIAGHSFGGKVATLINPENLILLSTAGILEEKSLKVKTKICFAKIFNKLGLRKITKSFRSDDVKQMSHEMYETFKNVVDEDFTFIFESFEKNAMIFWGKADTATTLPAGEKIHKLIKNSSFSAYEGDHYFFLKHAKDICEKIENGLK
ncbi:alpha/beta fold hydrolase [Halarcobacter bivalviorum]|uniref:alpha/beta fold hydrolase n=1 Tax=Halarcobacter bivalviorum TaxID=663364 RepID=UPI00100A3229|nr:alpha/beta hydrolase [Halarcobacter bivalviorum]RXK06990.1 2-hydroxy-6-oxohepta-2,4-dienoate hydrolase [Halarcobacter bivalviorum]